MVFEKYKNSKVLNKKRKNDTDNYNCLNSHTYNENIIIKAKRFLNSKFNNESIDDKRRLSKTSFRILE